MYNVVNEQFAAASKVVQEQSNRIASDLNSATDGTNAALMHFNTSMEQAHAKRREADVMEVEARSRIAAKRAEADQIEADAIRALDTAITNSQSVSIAIINQLADGRVVTGSPAKVERRRPKLVAGAAEGGGN